MRVIGFQMSDRSARAMQTLSRFGELAWFALPVESHPVYGYYQVPYLGWRFRSPREGVAQLIEDAVKAQTTQVEWSLDRTRRNWLLLPTRVLHEAQGIDNPAFAEVIHSINIQDQDFCSRALSDLELILQGLQQAPIPED